MERRRFIKISVAGAVGLGALGIGGLALRRTRLVEPLQPLTFFDPREYSIFAAASDAILPDEPVIEDADRWVASAADDFLGRCEYVNVADLKRVLPLLDNALAGLFIAGTAAPFSHLDRAARRRVLDRWRFSNWTVLRSAYQAVRRLVLATYYSNDATWPTTGYPGPPELGAAFDAMPEPLLDAWVGK